MFPVLFEIPGVGFKVRSFGVLVALGFLVGLHVGGRLARRFGDDPEEDPARFGQAGAAMLIGVIAGARLLYVVVEVARYFAAEDGSGMTGERFVQEPWTILAVWQGGLVMYGGFLGAAVLGMRSVKKLGMRPLATLDYGLTAGFVGLGIGRIGCLLVGDDYGDVVPASLAGLPFPLTITVPSLEWLSRNEASLFPPALAGEVLWATQVWMSVNAFALAGVGLFLLRRRRFPGHTTLWLVLLYALTRFTIEAFRGDAIRGVWAFGLSTSQLISIVVAAVCVILVVRTRGRRESMPGSLAGAGAGAH